MRRLVVLVTAVFLLMNADLVFALADKPSADLTANVIRNGLFPLPRLSAGMT